MGGDQGVVWGSRESQGMAVRESPKFFGMGGGFRRGDRAEAMARLGGLVSREGLEAGAQAEPRKVFPPQ